MPVNCKAKTVIEGIIFEKRYKKAKRVEVVKLVYVESAKVSFFLKAIASDRIAIDLSICYTVCEG